MRGKLNLAVAMLALTAACGGGTEPTPEDHVGEYVLRTINGHAPPQIIAEDENGVASIVGGIVILRADESYTDSTDVQVVNSAGVGFRAEVARGRYRLSNDSVFFALELGEYPMVRKGVELIQDFNGITLVYRR